METNSQIPSRGSSKRSKNRRNKANELVTSTIELLELLGKLLLTITLLILLILGLYKVVRGHLYDSTQDKIGVVERESQK
jgi:flagellar biogenesis protein FliO